MDKASLLKRLYGLMKLGHGRGVYADLRREAFEVVEVEKTLLGTAVTVEDEQSFSAPKEQTEEGSETSVLRSAVVGIPTKEVHLTIEDTDTRADSKQHRGLVLSLNDSASKLASDVWSIKVGEREVTLRAVCRQALLDDVKRHCVGAGFEASCVEPAGMAAIRASFDYAPALATDKTEVRVLLGAREGVATLLCGSQVLSLIPLGGIAPSVATSAIRLLQHTVKKHSWCPELSRIVVVGSSECLAMITMPAATGCEVVSVAGKLYEELIAYGLALRPLVEKGPCLNLATVTMEVLPLREAVLRVISVSEVIAITLCFIAAYGYGLFQYSALEEGLSMAKKRLRSTSAAIRRIKKHKLKGKIKEMEDTCNKFHRFLERRVDWTSLLGTLGDILPEGTVLEGFQCCDPFKKDKKAKNKIIRTMRLAIALDGNGQNLSARSVDGLIQRIKEADVIKANFKNVSLAAPVDWQTEAGHLKSARLVLECSAKIN